MNVCTAKKRTGEQEAANFVTQGSILAMAGVLVHTIGMLYRMPLSDIIGKQGNGYYTSAFSVYNILLISSSYSMPVTVSKMIAVHIARGGYRNCSRILKAAPIYATVVGDVATAMLWLGTDLFADLIRAPFSRYAPKTLAPTIQVMAYLGVLRGYFQGAGTIVLTAVSQILERIINTIVSVVAAGILFNVGVSMNAAQGAKDYAYALDAAGGTIGTGAGALTALVYFMILTCSRGQKMQCLARKDVSGKTESHGHLVHILTITVLLIVASSGIHNCSNMVDNYLFDQGMYKLGYLEDSIATYWGALGQYQLPFNILAAVSNTLSSSLIPPLTRTVANRNRKEELECIATTTRFSLLIATPATVGITVLAKPVCNLLFISEDNTMLIRPFMVGSLTVVFYSLSTVTNAILQGLGRLDVPIRHAMAALVVHVAALEVSLLVLKMGIYSMVFANIIFAFVMCLLNGHAIAKYVRYRREYKKTILLPTLCSLIMGAATYGVYRLVYGVSPPSMMKRRLEMAAVVFPPVTVAIVVCTLLLVRLKTVDEEELMTMPGGRRLVRLLRKTHLLAG